MCLPYKVKSTTTRYLTPFTLYYPPDISPLETTILFLFCVYEFCLSSLFICSFLFHISHMSEIIWFLIFWFDLFCLAWYFQDPLCCHKWQYFTFLMYYCTPLCIWKNWKHLFAKIYASLCLLQHYSWWTRHGNNWCLVTDGWIKKVWYRQGWAKVGLKLFVWNIMQ